MEYEIQIPFSGFYNAHESEADREIESLADYYAECGDDIPDWLMDLAQDSANYSQFFDDYSREYVEAFLEWLGIDGEFSGMESPREYNFQTDRVFAKITRDGLARLWRMADEDVLTRVCKNRLTSCSGFISHYDPDWKTWGKLSTWDHNQLGMLAIAAAEYEQCGDFGLWDEHNLMESFYGNGGTSSALWQGDKAYRFWRIFDYMKARAERPIRTLAQWHAARRAENRPWGDTPLGATA